MKYKEEISYHEETEEDVREVYPQEVMEPDFEEESFEENFDDAFDESFDESTDERAEKAEEKEDQEEEPEHLSGFEYVSLKNSLCMEYMGEAEGDPCERKDRLCPLQFIDENGEYKCLHSLIKTETDYNKCERLLIDYRREKSLNRSVLLSHFPDFDLENYLTQEGKLWLDRKYKGENNE